MNEPSAGPQSRGPLKTWLVMAFNVFFSWTIASYAAFFFLAAAVPKDAGLGGLTMVLLGEILFFVILILAFLALNAIERTLFERQKAWYWSVGSLSIAYWLFSALIFPNIGRTFSLRMVAPQNARLGDMLSIQLEPSSGFYTNQIAIPITLIKPDGTAIQPSGHLNTAYFTASSETQGCSHFLTLLWCTPAPQTLKIYLPAGPQDNFQAVPFQFDEPGTYVLSSPDQKVQGASILVTAPTGGLPIVLSGNALITAIPDLTISQPNVSFDNSGFLTFSAYYLSAENETYMVNRTNAAALDAQQEENICDHQTTTTTTAGCRKIPYTLRSIGATTTIEGNTVFVAHSWKPALTAAQVASNPSSKYFDEVYWVSGNGLIKIIYNNNSGHSTGKNAYDGPLFQAYIKQYPSTL